MRSCFLSLFIGLGAVFLFMGGCQPTDSSSSSASSTEAEGMEARSAAQQIPDRGKAVPRVSPNALVGQTIGVTEVRITYGRPSARGRKIFGGLVSFNEVWRTGANEATTISFSTPVRIEGQTLEKGTYGFFTIPGPDQWTLIFNNEPDQWGGYNYDSSRDALRVQVEPESAPAREMMTFSFTEATEGTATCFLHWAETRVPFEISPNTTEIVRTRAETKVAKTSDWQVPLKYVDYALENKVLLNEALSWANRSIQIEERFDNLRMKARVLAASGQFEKAVETANAAVAKEKEMDETPDGLEELRSKITTWESEI